MSIDKVKVGDVYALPEGPDRREIEHTVQAACGEDRGQHYCVTCEVLLRNNMETNGHVYGVGVHRMAWVCLTHGLERP